MKLIFLKDVFMKINQYPKTVVENTLKTLRDKINEERTPALTSPGQGMGGMVEQLPKV